MNDLLVDGLDIINSFKRNINPVIYTLNGVAYEDFNPFLPDETPQVLAMQENLRDSGKEVQGSWIWYTDADLPIDTRVKFKDRTYLVNAVSDYAATGYTNIRKYTLDLTELTPDTLPDDKPDVLPDDLPDELPEG